MIHVYKTGGIRKNAEGKEYSIKAINETELSDNISDGWFTSLEKALPEDVIDNEPTNEEKKAAKAAKAKATRQANKEKKEAELKADQDDNKE